MYTHLFGLKSHLSKVNVALRARSSLIRRVQCVLGVNKHPASVRVERTRGDKSVTHLIRFTRHKLNVTRGTVTLLGFVKRLAY